MAKRSDLLDFAVLGLLHDSPMHGYELRKRLNAALGTFRALSYGTLYPCLKALSAQGLIAAQTAAAPVAGARARIVYELTAEGKERFTELVSRADATAYEDEGFDVRLAFFARTEAEVRMRILEGRRSRLQERLDLIRSASVANRERMDTWTAALHRYGEDSARHEVRWLTELIDAERQAPPSRLGDLTDPNHPAFAAPRPTGAPGPTREHPTPGHPGR